MNRAFLLLIILGAACAHHPDDNALAPASRTAEVTRQLLAIEAEITRANQECDYAYFRQVEADEFIFTDGNGGVSTKAEDLAGEATCRRNTAYTQALDEVKVLVYDDVAVLNARQTTSLTRNGEPVTRRARFTDVFVWRDGRWQLVSGQSTRIPSQP